MRATKEVCASSGEGNCGGKAWPWARSNGCSDGCQPGTESVKRLHSQIEDVYVPLQRILGVLDDRRRRAVRSIGICVALVSSRDRASALGVLRGAPRAFPRSPGLLVTHDPGQRPEVG